LLLLLPTPPAPDKAAELAMAEEGFALFCAGAAISLRVLSVGVAALLNFLFTLNFLMLRAYWGDKVPAVAAAVAAVRAADDAAAAEAACCCWNCWCCCNRCCC